MEGIDNTLRLHEFNGVGSEDPEQHLFFCKTVWATTNIPNEVVRFAQLATMLRGHTLLWYMKLHINTPTRKDRNLEEIKKALLKEFKKPKSESQYMTELKEVKSKSLWDCNQRFKVVMEKMNF
jgi:hypothetical protein